MNFIGSKAFYIDEEGLDHEIDPMVAPMYIAQNKYTVKVEGIEYDLPPITDQPHTVHAYFSPQGAISFPVHTDPYPVFIHVLKGIKVMEVEGEEISLCAGATLKIDTNVPHRAINKHDSIMLSIGYDATE